MNDKGEHFHRRSIRFRGYDYSRDGAYFVTIVAHNREMLFGEIVGGEMKLSEVGEIVARCWREIPQHFTMAALDEFVVMPDHMHGIIVIKHAGDQNVDGNGGAQHVEPLRNAHPGDDAHPGDNAHPRDHEHPRVSRQTQRNAYQHIIPKSLGSIVRSFKGAVTRECGKRRIPFRWQRNYHERIIRDNGQLNNTRKYIRNNPTRWFIENGLRTLSRDVTLRTRHREKK